ncbi:MAG TPA: EAL domain-containing protein [Candidatus Elarobacter sp.]|jgi:diguanylate cyclase (GGDEF)-like protein/PAS domain S-box-containing protein
MNFPLALGTAGGFGIALSIAVTAIAVLTVYALRLRLFAATLRRERAGAREQRARLLDAVPDGMYVVDEHLRIVHVNTEAARMLHASAGALVGRALQDVVDPLASELLADVRCARRTGEQTDRNLAVPGTGTVIEVRATPAGSDVVVSLRDVGERARAAARVRDCDQRVRMLTDNVDAVLWTTDLDACFTSVAGAALADLGLRADDLVGRPSAALIAEHVLHDVCAGTPVRAETVRGQRWLRHHVEPLRDDADAIVGAVGVSLDVTALKRAHQRLFESTHRDRVTGLPNRLSLEQRIDETIADARRDGRRCALLFVGLNHFRTISDALGQGAGDDVLRDVALRLQGTLRAGDVIATPGGEEFVILMPRVGSNSEVESVAQRLLGALALPVTVRGRELFVDASVGAAIFPEHGDDTESLGAHADAAMQRAKTLAGERFALYDDDSLQAAADERLALDNDLRHAVARGELRLLYQPVIDVATRRIVGCEALVRWHHQTRGVVSPGVFIAIAEQSGAIVALDRWVLREACATAARVRSYEPGFRMAVNLSPYDLREPDFPDVVATMLIEHSLRPGALSIEVNEHDLLDDGVVLALRRICALGVEVTVDDFGVGYGSFPSLKRLPVTALKVDRAFIRDVAEDAYDRAIVGSIVAIAKTLGLRVTAEGIETDDQLGFVASLGCDEAQGFRFGAPMTGAELEAALAPPPRLCLAERAASV